MNRSNPVEPRQSSAPLTTQQALAGLNDAGLFERIASAVIRIKYPEYAELVELGTNVDGKTRKAPVDGITPTYASGSLRVVMVQHTIAAAKELRGKWLHDPSKVKPRKSGKASQPAGDALKAQEIAAAERSRNPETSVILFLTTNEEPDQELARDVVSFGADHRLDVRILSRSAIAHVLDHTPEGQSVRRRLGVVQEMLTWDLLRELGTRSVDEYPLSDDKSVRVSTRTQIALQARKGPLTLLSGPSGSGKSVAAHDWLRSALDDKTIACLVLRERTLEDARGLDEAIIAELRVLHPALESGAFLSSILTPGRQLRLVVEDLANANDPLRLLERIVGWLSSTSAAKGEGASRVGWHLVCPVQYRTISSVPVERVKTFEPYRVEITPLSPHEASEAVRRRSASQERKLTTAEASSIAELLGHDPLLIGLHDPSEVSDPSRVIENYVARKLDQFAAGRPTIRIRVERALVTLTEAMLQQRTISPTLNEIIAWSTPAGYDQITCDLLDFGELVSIAPSGKGSLSFRHDRVRDWLLSDCFRRQFDSGSLVEDVLEEPFYAEWIGAGSARSNNPVANGERLIRLNPLAAFTAYARAASRKDMAALHPYLVAWLDSDGGQGRGNETLRWMVQRTLAEVEADGVLELLSRFLNQNHFSDFARLRNGDLRGALRLCSSSGISMHYPERDELILHIAAKREQGFLAAMTRLIQDPKTTGWAKSSALCVAGISGCEELGDALANRWSLEKHDERDPFLADYIWAAVHCYGRPSASKVLDAALDRWAELLSEENEEGDELERRTFRMDELRLGFAIRPPAAALHHLLRRAQDPALENALAWTLGEIDHPRAVLFKITFEAAVSGRGGFVVNGLHEHWSRRIRNGAALSDTSRQALFDLWRDPTAQLAERRIGLRLWAISASADELSSLATLETDSDLSDTALRARMERGDLSCVQQLSARFRISKQAFHWWLHAYKVVCPAILEELPDMLRSNASDLSDLKRGYGWAKVAADLLTRNASSLAERILIDTWPLAGQHGSYVQAALFIGGAPLEALAERTIAVAEDPKELFRFVGMFFEGIMDGHPGATREDQLRRMLPYRNHLDDFGRKELRRVCDKLGFFTLGSEFDDEYDDRTWTPETLNEQFEKVASERPFSFRIEELERTLGERLDRRVVLDRMRTWLIESRNPAAAEVAADVLRSIGNVEDVQLLASAPFEYETDCEALIADTLFAIKRRGLQPIVA
ncbi:hypothetical protein SAMN03159422_04513 [Agrobacterium fabrum]|uniref:hypothetical protein n=1 Tax=Agrobacterium fabrum TaxID=1176649 RepID=UPI00088CAD64|nr:hypothetical protein [Agrobacterium fabrum]SDB72556.1 hypothetical protein SAMN03159422_04513 [Agrobacterium fabrum]SES02947.1 hypothetical protein SAMN03159504_04376 [Agrobacterium fabrum]